MEKTGQIEKTSNHSAYKYEVLPEEHKGYDLSFKIIVLGNSFVGKSCLTNKATKNTFYTDYQATIGFEFYTFNLKLNDATVKLQIWDTCGQEQYKSLITNFYRNSSLSIMVYAINNQESFDAIENWVKELKLYSNPDAKIFLVGNKIDLEEERVVSKEEGQQIAEDYKMNLFIETSSKTGLNAQKVFIEAAAILFEDYNKYNPQGLSSSQGEIPLNQSDVNHDSITLDNQPPEEPEKKCKC